MGGEEEGTRNPPFKFNDTEEPHSEEAFIDPIQRGFFLYSPL